MADKNGDGSNIITLPSGEGIDASEIGAPDYILGQGGQVPTPELIDPLEQEKLLKERERYVENQELVRVIDDKAHPIDIITVVLKEIAEELSHLKWERKEAVRRGEKNAANYTVARITSLKSVSDILVKHKTELIQEGLDFKSPKIQRLFRKTMEMFYDAMQKSGVEKRDIDLVFSQIQSNMPEWEEKISEEMRSTS